jgi:hypothetical protein
VCSSVAAAIQVSRLSCAVPGRNLCGADAFHKRSPQNNINLRRSTEVPETPASVPLGRGSRFSRIGPKAGGVRACLLARGRVSVLPRPSIITPPSLPRHRRGLHFLSPLTALVHDPRALPERNFSFGFAAPLTTRSPRCTQQQENVGALWLAWGAAAEPRHRAA